MYFLSCFVSCQIVRGYWTLTFLLEEQLIMFFQFTGSSRDVHAKFLPQIILFIDLLKIKRFIRRVAHPGYWNLDMVRVWLAKHTNWITIFAISRIWISLNKRSQNVSHWVFALVYNTPWKFSGEVWLSYYIQKHFSLIVN